MANTSLTAKISNSRPPFQGRRTQSPRTYNHRPPRGNNTRLPADKWQHLSQEDRRAWNSISKETKAIILGIHSPTNPTTPPRRSMLHDMSALDFFQKFHHSTPEPDGSAAHDPSDGQLLINASSSNKHISPADIRKVLSSAKNKMQTSTISPDMQINGSTYRRINTHSTYHVSEHQQTHTSSLVDRGANGGIAGNDVRLIPSLSSSPHRSVNIMGIDNHQLTDVPLVSVGGTCSSHVGPVILIFHQYAHYGKGKSIHSPVQLEAFHNEVNDKSSKLPGGGQFIKTNDGYTFPLDICSGLPYLPLRPFSDIEWDTLPHVFMTADCEWNPKLLDNVISSTDSWITNVNHINPGHKKSFDHFGYYQKRNISTHATSLPPKQHTSDDDGAYFDPINSPEPEQFFFDADTSLTPDTDNIIQLCMELEVTPHNITIASPTKTTTTTPDYPALCSYFAWLPPNIVQLTFKHTTQYARQIVSAIMK